MSGISHHSILGCLHHYLGILPLLHHYLDILQLPAAGLGDYMYIVPEVVQAVEMVLGLLLPGTVYAFLPAYAQFSSKPGGARIRRSQDQEELGSGGARTRRSQDQEEPGSGDLSLLLTKKKKLCFKD